MGSRQPVAVTAEQPHAVRADRVGDEVLAQRWPDVDEWGWVVAQDVDTFTVRWPDGGESTHPWSDLRR